MFWDDAADRTAEFTWGTFSTGLLRSEMSMLKTCSTRSVGIVKDDFREEVSERIHKQIARSPTGVAEHASRMRNSLT